MTKMVVTIADDELKPLLCELELRLMQPQVRCESKGLEAMLADEFFEVGVSGRIYDKAAIIAELISEKGSPSRSYPERFDFRRLSPAIAQLTYEFEGVFRSSIWREEADQWRIIFHQATRLA